MVRKRKSQSKQAEEDVVPLKAIREELNLTQAQFAVAIGVDPSTISRCERGLAEPNLTVLQIKRLCRLSKKPLEKLPDYLGKFPTQE